MRLKELIEDLQRFEKINPNADVVVESINSISVNGCETLIRFESDVTDSRLLAGRVVITRKD